MGTLLHSHILLDYSFKKYYKFLSSFYVLFSRKVLERPSNLGSSKRVKTDENESREEEKDELSSGIAPKLG